MSYRKLEIILALALCAAGCGSSDGTEDIVPGADGFVWPDLSLEVDGSGPAADAGLPPGTDSGQVDPPEPEEPATEPPAPPTPPPTPSGPTRFELAKHWAPVWYHDTDDRKYEADYFTAFDFDGDKRSDNNWENLETTKANLGAVIYYSVVETKTHWFILYANFHPRDWAKDCTPWNLSRPCHENDMEGTMVVVRKSSATYGTFEVLYTEAHNQLHIYANNPAIIKKSGRLEKGIKVTFEGGSHPEVYVESKGHGVCALYHSEDGHCEHPMDGTPPSFGGDDGIVYRYKGVAETPSSGNDRDVGYSLRSLQYNLWNRRSDICDSGCTYDKTFTYDGVTYPMAFDGDTYDDDKANPPWAWDDPDDGPVYRGDFFFRPAKALATHVSVPGTISQTYLFNPFLP